MLHANPQATDSLLRNPWSPSSTGAVRSTYGGPHCSTSCSSSMVGKGHTTSQFLQVALSQPPPCPPFISPIGQMRLLPFQGSPPRDNGKINSCLRQAHWMGKSNQMLCLSLNVPIFVLIWHEKHIWANLAWEAYGPCKRRRREVWDAFGIGKPWDLDADYKSSDQS